MDNVFPMELVGNQNKQLSNAFLAACTTCNKEIVQDLLKSGASINASDKFNRTGLHIVAADGKKELVEILLNDEANIDAKDANSWTPLHLAAMNGHNEVVRLLLAKGAQSHLQDRYGKTALHLAALNGYVEIVSLLADAYLMAITDTQGNTALQCATLAGQKEVVKLLLLRGASRNIQNKKGLSLLHLAAIEGHCNVTEVLLEEGADINGKDREGKTALDWAIALAHKKLIHLLLSKDAEVNFTARDSSGSTLLHAAASTYNLEIIDFLLSKGADVNVHNHKGETPLHRAASARNKSVVELLLLKGADPNAKDNDGWTALHVATNSGYKEIAELFQGALLAQALMRLLHKNKEIVFLMDPRLWLHADYPIVLELQKLAEERKSLLYSTMQNKPLAISSQIPALLPQEINMSNEEQEQAYFGEKHTREFNGLALDGEGLEAVITASMVKTLEEELKCPMHQLFDCIVGTSFGGIVALGLVASEEGDCPLFGTDDLIKFFEKYNTISQTLTRKNKLSQSGDHLKQRLNALFKGSRLSDALTQIIAPCKRVQENQFFVFDSKEAQKKEASNYYIRDIGHALLADDFHGVDMGLLGLVAASSEYKNKSAELLFKKMKASLHENQRENFNILYCAGNAEDEGHKRVHNELTEELNASAVRYCRIKPEKIGPFDGKELVAVYKEKGEAAAENFLKGNEPFIHKLQENKARKGKASY